MSRRHKCIKPVRVKTNRQQRRAMRRLLVPAQWAFRDEYAVATDGEFLNNLYRLSQVHNG